MIPTFTPASDIVPENLDAKSWDAVEPLYHELLNRQLHCQNCLQQLILDRSEIDAALSEAGSVLYINMTCQTDDAAAGKAYIDFVENVQPRLKEISFEIDKKIAASPFLKDMDQTRYQVFLRDLKVAIDLFRPENVPIETELTRLDQEYSQICGGLMVNFQGQERTLPQMSRFNEEPDRAVREQAWRAVADRRLLEADKLDTIFEKMLDLRRQLAVNAGFANFRDYAFAAKRRFDYTPQTCHEFADGVEKVCTPLLRQIMAERGKAMNISSLRPWDGQVDPHGRAALRPFENAQQLVERTTRLFKRMDPALAGMFEYLQDGDRGASSSCLDLESRKGKAPGGYQANRDRMRKPFIFMNAAGVQRDIETIVHEAGHSFHSLLSRADPLVSYRSDIPMEFAEVASMSMELVAHPFLDEFYGKPEADRARRQHLEGVINSLATIAVVDQFQHWLYTNVGHSRRQRHEKWAELTRRFGPGFDWTGLDSYLLTGWHRILHLFGVPFYYIEYGIAQLGALQVWLNYRKDPKRAIEMYKQGLSLGGSRPLPELFKTAGLEFEFGPKAIRRLMDLVVADLAKMPA